MKYHSLETQLLPVKGGYSWFVVCRDADARCGFVQEDIGRHPDIGTVKTYEVAHNLERAMRDIDEFDE